MGWQGEAERAKPISFRVKKKKNQYIRNKTEKSINYNISEVFSKMEKNARRNS